MVGNVAFLMKDVVLFAVSVYLLKQDVERALMSPDSAKARGRQAALVSIAAARQSVRHLLGRSQLTRRNSTSDAADIYCEPTAIHPEHEGKHAEFLIVERRAVRRRRHLSHN
jgi:hypothetical protein